MSPTAGNNDALYMVKAVNSFPVDPNSILTDTRMRCWWSKAGNPAKIVCVFWQKSHFTCRHIRVLKLLIWGVHNVKRHFCV